MESADSKIYPGIAREPNTFGTADPNDPAKLMVTTCHPAPYTRRVSFMLPNSTSLARQRRSSSARTVPTGPCFRPSTV